MDCQFQLDSTTKLRIANDFLSNGASCASAPGFIFVEITRDVRGSYPLAADEAYPEPQVFTSQMKPSAVRAIAGALMSSVSESALDPNKQTR